MTPYEFWDSIGSPKYVCAPMVDQSELAFRLLVRNYGCDLTYTPMIHSVLFSTVESYRNKWLDDIHPDIDNPSFVQFCGHDPELLLKAGKIVEDKAPCVDINLGCPQHIAKRGHYGSFLLEDTDLVKKIAGYLANNLKCAVSCKIRLFKNNINRSIELAKDLEKCGIKVLTVHGRTKEQNKEMTGSCNFDAIRAIKEVLTIPVISNGGLQDYDDIDKCFEYTKCDAVMSSEKLLENPFFFDKNRTIYNIDNVALEYLEIAERLNTDISYIRSHLFKFYYGACQVNNSFNARLVGSKSMSDFYSIAEDIREFRKHLDNKDKFGWYMRYRKEAEKRNERTASEKEMDTDVTEELNFLFS